MESDVRTDRQRWLLSRYRDWKLYLHNIYHQEYEQIEKLFQESWFMFM